MLGVWDLCWHRQQQQQTNNKQNKNTPQQKQHKQQQHQQQQQNRTRTNLTAFVKSEGERIFVLCGVSVGPLINSEKPQTHATEEPEHLKLQSCNKIYANSHKSPNICFFDFRIYLISTAEFCRVWNRTDNSRAVKACHVTIRADDTAHVTGPTRQLKLCLCVI